MHNRSDQFAKSLLRDGLSLVSATETEVEVLAATQKIDVYSVPDPAREAERAGMGLLGELSREPSLFEPFRGTPSLRLVRRCLRKQLTWHHELERRARAAAGSAAPAPDADAPPQPPVDFPALVVISPGRPETVLDAYRCEPVQAGVYHAVPGLVMRVVVLAELPRTRATLLLRLLGSGRLLREALADLAALPDDAWEKSIAKPLLVHFRLGVQEPTNDEEDEVSAEIRAWFEDYERKLRAEERKEGRNEGRAEEAARAVLTALRVRGITVPDAARERILAEKEPETLERWHERAIVAASLAEVLDTLS
ncbi:hypothetical protein [Sorangium sp. So ce1182]|uniref:hypothetical protein n=1 Tax=Sorangium sp. So ce1182 TaxID=3133334 RepID=UPI003F622B57